MQQQQQQQPPRSAVDLPPVEASSRTLDAICYGLKTREFIRDGKTARTATALLFARAATVNVWGPMKQEDGTDQSGIGAVPENFQVVFDTPEDVAKVEKILLDLGHKKLAAFPRRLICDIERERPQEYGPTRAQGSKIDIRGAL